MQASIRSTTFLSAVVGLCAGALSQRLFSLPAYGQLLLQPPSRPENRQGVKEVDAQAFVLVDSNGKVQAEIKLVNGQPEIVLYDRDGRVGWRATPSSGSGLHPVTENRHQ